MAVGSAVGFGALQFVLTSAAEDHFLKSVEAFSSVPIPFEIANTFLDLGALCHRRGDPLSAEARIADARRIFAGLDLPRYVERAERLVVELRVPFNS